MTNRDSLISPSSSNRSFKSILHECHGVVLHIWLRSQLVLHNSPACSDLIYDPFESSQTMARQWLSSSNIRSWGLWSLRLSSANNGTDRGVSCLSTSQLKRLVTRANYRGIQQNNHGIEVSSAWQRENGSGSAIGKHEHGMIAVTMISTFSRTKYPLPRLCTTSRQHRDPVRMRGALASR